MADRAEEGLRPVVGYDRRSRGESGPGAGPYEMPREVEDLVAVMGAVDPDASVGRSTRAVQAFLRLLGVPTPVVLLMPLLPVWKKLTASADTLPNDFEIVSPYRRGLPLPEGHDAGSTVPTLLIAGGKSPTHMQRAPVAGDCVARP